MPRRIIYIRNPSSGSHFRTLGANGTTRRPYNPKPKKPKAPKSPKPPKTVPTDNGMGGNNGYMPGYQTPTNWWLNNNTPQPPNFGSYDGPGVGPYEQEFTPTFVDPETLLGQLYDIATGIAPGGNIQHPPGTPGVLKFGAGTIMDDVYQERLAAGAASATSYHDFYGNTPKLPQTFLNPKRNKPRPWWAK